VRGGNRRAARGDGPEERGYVGVVREPGNSEEGEELWRSCRVGGGPGRALYSWPLEPEKRVREGEEGARRGGRRSSTKEGNVGGWER